jgi:hypothetical protein
LHFERLEDRTLLTITASGIPAWQPAGPAPEIDNHWVNAQPNDTAVGAIESIAVHENVPGDPADGYVVYAGAVNGGVWRSDNIFGDPTKIHWQPLTDNQASLATSSLALDPLDPSGQTLWVGTGSLSSWMYTTPQLSGPDVGLLKTTDGGTQWVDLAKAQFAHDRIVGVVPTGRLYPTGPTKGEEVVLVAGLDQSGVMRSIDGGQTFQPVVGGVSGTAAAPVSASSLVADPGNSGRYFAVVNGVVYMSNDGYGELWTSIDPGIAGSTALKLAVYSSGSSTVLYAEMISTAAAPAGTTGNLFTGVERAVINNQGLQPSWSPVAPGSVPGGWYITQAQSAIAADPTNANVVYVSGQGIGGQGLSGYSTNDQAVFRGDAAKNNWNSLTQNTITTHRSPHPDSRSLVFLGPDNPGVLLESDDGGIYELQSPQKNGGGSWFSLNGDIQTTEFFSVAYASGPGLIFGGSQDQGSLIQTQTGSTTWQLLPGATGDGGTVAVDNAAYGSDEYYFGDSTLYYDNNTLVAMENVSNPYNYSGLNAADYAAWGPTADQDAHYPVITNPVVPDELLIGMTGVYESTDDGQDVTNVTPKGMTGTGNVWVTALAYGTDDPTTAYVASNSGQLFVRYYQSKAYTFSPLHTPWTIGGGTYAQAIAVDADDSQIAYVLDSTGKIWETTDAGLLAGAKWTNITGNLDNLCSDLQTIALYDPTPGSNPGDDVVLAGGLGGVFRHWPGAYGWSLYGSGLPDVVVTDLSYYPRSGLGIVQSGDLLLAGTFGRGAWTVPDASATLATPPILSGISGSDAGGNIIVQLDQSDPQFAEVFVNNLLEFYGQFAPTVTIDAGGQGNTLTVNSTYGNPLGTGKLVYDGAAGNNQLILQGTPPTPYTNETVRATSAGSGTIVLDDSEIDYSQLSANNSESSPVEDTVQATNLSFSTTDPFSFIDNNGSDPSEIAIGTSAGNIISFKNKTNVVLDGGSRPSTTEVELQSGGTVQQLTIVPGITSAGQVSGVDVLSTPASVTTTVTNSNLATERVEVHNFSLAIGRLKTIRSAGVQTILGTVVINDPWTVGGTTLIVDDSAGPGGHFPPGSGGDNKARSVTINGTAISGLAPAVISYADTDQLALTVTGGNGGNFYDLGNLNNINHTGPILTLNTGGGADTISVNALGSVHFGATINGGGGNDTLEVTVGPGSKPENTGGNGSGEIQWSGAPFDGSITYHAIQNVSIKTATLPKNPTPPNGPTRQ